MLKFIKHHMETIIGIEIYPLISFILFFAFFTGLFVWVYYMKKDELTHLSNIPLNDTNDSKNSEK